MHRIASHRIERRSRLRRIEQKAHALRHQILRMGETQPVRQFYRWASKGEEAVRVP